MTVTDLPSAAKQAAASANLGKASARKRGRNPEFPYVPVIEWNDRTEIRTTNARRGMAFATREAAIEYAQACIDARRAKLAQNLAERRYRALREQYGLPREVA